MRRLLLCGLLAGAALGLDRAGAPLARADTTPYEARVLGEAGNQGEHFSLSENEMRTLPGGLGDPFRMITMMPGVATPIPVLPSFVVRGASPGMSGYFLDGMRVPQIFHLLIGGGVVHPRILGRLDFYPGSYDASFGRFAGGIVDAETRPAGRDRQRGEVELRIYDASAAFDLRLGKEKDVRLSLSGHYGYPGPIISAIVPGISLQYWDYQLRLDFRGFTFQALGSYDSLVVTRSVPDEFRLTFHRLQARYRGVRGRLSYEAALVGGYDQALSFGGGGVHKLSVSARLGARYSTRRFTLSAGADTELSRFAGENFLAPGPGQNSAGAGSAPDLYGELQSDRDGVVAGAWLRGEWDVLPGRLSATLSARADLYYAAGITLLSLDPRLQVRLRAQPWLTMTAGGGVYQQPPSFPVALPGLDTFALSIGLQRAIHGAVGIEVELPLALRFSATGYYQKFHDVNDFNLNDFNIDLNLSPSALRDPMRRDTMVSYAAQFCTTPPPEKLSGLAAQGLRQQDGEAYGVELYLRRQQGRLTGWLSYSLGRSERFFSCGLLPADLDQTHVFNAVLQLRLPWSLMAGARLLVSTGRPVSRPNAQDGRITVRNNERLPTYVQLDLRLDREWIFKRWALSLFLEAVNATFSESIIAVSYPMGASGPPKQTGFPFILPSLGARGRF